MAERNEPQASFDHCDRLHHWHRCGALRNPLDTCPEGHLGTLHDMIVGGTGYLYLCDCPDAARNMADSSRPACTPAAAERRT